MHCGRTFAPGFEGNQSMNLRSRARMAMALVVAAIALAACRNHPESAGSRSDGHHRGPYGGVEGGAGF
jgi:hypothetical protein